MSIQHAKNSYVDEFKPKCVNREKWVPEGKTE